MRPAGNEYDTSKVLPPPPRGAVSRSPHGKSLGWKRLLRRIVTGFVAGILGRPSRRPWACGRNVRNVQLFGSRKVDDALGGTRSHYTHVYDVSPNFNNQTVAKHCLAREPSTSFQRKICGSAKCVVDGSKVDGGGGAALRGSCEPPRGEGMRLN